MRSVFPSDFTEDVQANVVRLLSYTNDFVSALGAAPASIHLDKLERLSACLRPTLLGVRPDKYRTVARFVTLFVDEAPIASSFSKDSIGDLSSIPNHQNIIVALSIAFDSLDVDGFSLGAVLYSRLIESLAPSAPHCERLLAVLFEVLASNANQDQVAAGIRHGSP